MKTNKIKNLILGGIACMLTATSCDVEPTFYSQVVPETFYTSQDAVWEHPLALMGSSRPCSLGITGIRN